jgi:hypothetical protein
MANWLRGQRWLDAPVADQKIREGEDGVHLAHPFDEGTLCGVYHGDDLTETTKRTVTCEQCIRFINMVRRARCAERYV